MLISRTLMPRSGTIALKLPSAQEAELASDAIPGGGLHSMDMGLEPVPQYPLVIGVPADDNVMQSVHQLS